MLAALSLALGPMGCKKPPKSEAPVCEVCNYEHANLLNGKLRLDINEAKNLLDSAGDIEGNPEEIKQQYIELSRQAQPFVDSAKQTEEKLRDYYTKAGSSKSLQRLLLYSAYIGALAYKSDLLENKPDVFEELEKISNAANLVDQVRSAMADDWQEEERSLALSLMTFCLKLCLDSPADFSQRSTCLTSIDAEIKVVLEEDSERIPYDRKIEGVVYQASFGILVHAGNSMDPRELMQRCTDLDGSFEEIQKAAKTERNSEDERRRWEFLESQAKAGKLICVRLLGPANASTEPTPAPEPR